MHSFTLLILTLSVFFFFASVPRGLGVSCNLSIGLSLAYPVTCSPSYLFLLTRFSIPSFFSINVSVLSFGLFFLFLFALAPLSAGFPELIISPLAACLWQGSLAGRKAGWWPLRSWVTQVRCKRCPWGASVSYLCGMPENTHALFLARSAAPQQAQPSHTGKGSPLFFFF